MSGVILICGGRDYANYEKIRELLIAEQPLVVIHGGARGCDQLTGEVARELGIQAAQVMAYWEYGHHAGPVRNQAMLRLGPEKVFAFPGGRGTENCVKQAQDLEIPVYRVS